MTVETFLTTRQGSSCCRRGRFGEALGVSVMGKPGTKCGRGEMGRGVGEGAAVAVDWGAWEGAGMGATVQT